MTIMGIREELRLSNLGLHHSEPRKFVTSEWGHNNLYTVWRLFWAIFHFSWLVTSLVAARTTMSAQSDGVALWFIYLSNWTYLLLTLTTLLDAAILIHVRTKRKDILKGFTPSLPWYMKLSWLLNSVVTEGSLHVSAFYWIFVFKGQELTVLRFIFHGVNSIYVLVNLLLTAMPVRLCHVIYPIIYGVIYAMFSVVYHILGGTNLKGEPYIYKIVNWSKWKRTLPVVSLSTFVALPVLYFLLYLTHLLRIHVRSRCEEKREEISILECSPERNNEDVEFL